MPLLCVEMVVVLVGKHVSVLSLQALIERLVGNMLLRLTGFSFCYCRVVLVVVDDKLKFGFTLVFP